jgi:hypothetical protein
MITARVDNEVVEPSVEDDSFDTAVFVTPNTSVAVEGDGIVTFDTSQLADGEESDAPSPIPDAEVDGTLAELAHPRGSDVTISRRLRRARKAEIERQAAAQLHTKKKKSPVVLEGRAQAEVAANEVAAEKIVSILPVQLLVDFE